VKCCFVDGASVDGVNIGELINGLARLIVYTRESEDAPFNVVGQYEGQFYDQTGSGFGRLIIDESGILDSSGNSMLQLGYMEEFFVGDGNYIFFKNFEKKF